MQVLLVTPNEEWVKCSCLAFEWRMVSCLVRRGIGVSRQRTVRRTGFGERYFRWIYWRVQQPVLEPGSKKIEKSFMEMEKFDSRKDF